MILGIYNIQEPQNARLGRNLRIIWSKPSFYRWGWLPRVKRLEGTWVRMAGKPERGSGSHFTRLFSTLTMKEDGRPHMSHRSHPRKPITRMHGTSITSWWQQESAVPMPWGHPAGKTAPVPSARKRHTVGCLSCFTRARQWARSDSLSGFRVAERPIRGPPHPLWVLDYLCPVSGSFYHIPKRLCLHPGRGRLQSASFCLLLLLSPTQSTTTTNPVALWVNSSSISLSSSSHWEPPSS